MHMYRSTDHARLTDHHEKQQQKIKVITRFDDMLQALFRFSETCDTLIRKYKYLAVAAHWYYRDMNDIQGDNVKIIKFKGNT